MNPTGLRPALFIAFAWISAVAVVPALAQEFSNPDNAATWYEQAYARMDQLSESDWAAIEEYDWNQPPTPELRAALVRARPIMELARHASQRSYSDYHLNYEDGPALLLPYLGKHRRLARLMRADAMAHLADGDAGAAIDRISSMIRMSSHLRDDRTMISALVGTAIYNVADDAIQSGIDRGKIGPHESAALSRAMSVLDPHDPFGTIESVSMEQVIFGEWLERTFYQDNGRQQIVDTFGEMQDDTDELEQMMMTMTDDEFRTNMQKYYATMDRYIEAFNHPDTEAGRAIIADIEAEIESGELDLITKMFLPAFGRVYEQLLKTRGEIEGRKELLEKIAKGEVAPEEIENAAVWYMRAVDEMKGIDPAWSDSIELLALSGRLADDLIPVLDEAADSTQTAIEYLFKGSKKRRCDFEYLQRQSELFAPPYLVGMRKALLLLELDALRRVARGTDEDRRAALSELATLFRMIAHLSKDQTLLSSPLAHDAFDRSFGIFADEFLDAHETQDDQNAALGLSDRQYRLVHGSILWISQSDPFGYLGSRVEMRDRLDGPLSSLAYQLADGKDVFTNDEAEAFLASCDGDALMFIFAIQNVINDDGNLRDDGPRSTKEADEFALLGLPALLEEARAAAPHFVDRLKNEVNPPLEEWSVTDRFRYEERRRTARSDLRSAIRRLELNRPEISGDVNEALKAAEDTR